MSASDPLAESEALALALRDKLHEAIRDLPPNQAWAAHGFVTLADRAEVIASKLSNARRVLRGGKRAG